MSQSTPAALEHSAATRMVLPLLLLTVTHFVVDTVACIVVPLWPSLEAHLGGGGVLWLFVVWTMSTSVTQLAFACLGERIRGGWILWAGPAVAIICLSAIGLVDSPWAMAALLILAGLGIAAFHPEAAAAAGASAPGHRARAMSVFALGGYFGQAAGPSYSGWLTDSQGLPGLGWTLVWGLPVLLLLLLGARRINRPTSAGSRSHVSLGEVVAGKLRAVFTLVSIGTLRVTGAMGIPLALAFLLKDAGYDNLAIGRLQSSFMAGIGSGSILCALLVTRHAERLVLGWMPLAAAPCIWITGMMIGEISPASYAVVLLTGLLIGVMLPVQISYGQQLLPGGQRVASSLTMGVSWGLGGGLVAGGMYLLQNYGYVGSAFGWMAAASMLSGMLLIVLPRPDQE